MKASLGPGVAALGVAVAVAQWHTNDVKLRLDSYDRRLRVYKATVAMLECLMEEIRARRGPPHRDRNDKPEGQYQELPEKVVATFEDCLLEAPFLFDEDVTRFMQLVKMDHDHIRMYAKSLVGISQADAYASSQGSSFEALRDSEGRIKRANRNVKTAFQRHLKLQRFQK